MSRLDTQRVKRSVARSEHRERSIGFNPLQELEGGRVSSEVERNSHMHLPEPFRVQGEHKMGGYVSPAPGENISSPSPPEGSRKHLVGATLVLAMVATLASGCSGGDGVAPKTTPAVLQAAQQVEDAIPRGKDAKPRVEDALQRVKKMKADNVQIQNLRNSGLLKPGEKALPFGEILIARSEEPPWHANVRENTISEMTSGKTLHSERDLKKAMIESAITEAKGEASPDRRPEVGLENLRLLEENLGTKLLNEIFDKVGSRR